MSLSSHSSGEGFTMPAKLRNLYQAQKVDISINIHGKRRTYTTLDALEGEVAITAPTDTSFDEIEIEFVGTARTYVERLTTAAAISGRSEAFHQFLKLTQPRVQDHYPENNILRAGQTYRFPFVFVIPQHLLPRVCQHRVNSDTLRLAHLQLPPSFGDKDPAFKDELHDDMVPDMASVRYGVFTRLSKRKEQGDETVKTTIANKARRLRVMPTTEELPPLDVSAGDDEYTMRKEKTIRKGMLKGKLGTLVMEASQPPSLRLRAGKIADSQTMATIMLRFDPTDGNSAPPRMNSMSSKLKVSTYFASTARHQPPSKNASLMDLSQGLHSEQLNLSGRCMANVEWTKHDPSKPDTPERRDSAVSTTSMTTGSIPEPSATYKGKAFYVARILVPITLPTNKTFVPTFHSCLISRVYALKLELGLQTAGIGGSMELKTPLQIAYDGSSDSNGQRGSVDSRMETEVEEDDVSDFFEPRTIRAPSDAYVGRSRIGSQAPIDEAPPGYSYFAPASRSGGRSVPVH